MSEFASLDPLSEEFHDDHNPSIEHMCDALDGDIYSQGITIDHRAWLDMGSEGWQKTPDKVKAAAWQVALTVGGWDAETLKNMMIHRYKHLKEGVMQLTIETLQELATQYPLHIEDVNVRKAEVLIQHGHHAPAEPPEQKLVLELGVNQPEPHSKES